MELRNWLLRFGCAPEEFRVAVDSLADWMANSSPPWSDYCALMACCLVALDKRPGVHPVGIGEMLRRALAKLVMRAAGDQAKMACGNFQLCAGLESGIEEATHTVEHRRLERVRARREETEDEAVAEAEEEEEGGGGVAGLLNNLNIETAGTEEEASEVLIEALRMEVEEEGASEGEEEGGGTLQALRALELLTQEAYQSGTTLVDAHNRFNEMSRLAMLWTVRHRLLAEARFAFNCYKHWEQLLLRQPGELPVTILSREGVTQGDPLSMVLYGITLVPLA